MTKEEKAKLLDTILLKFEGNKTFSDKEIHDERFYVSLDNDYYVVENNFNFLIGDEMIQPLYSSEGKSYVLTPKGFATMTDLENLGYVSKYNEEQGHKTLSTETLKYARWAVYLAVVSIILAVIGLVKCGSN